MALPLLKCCCGLSLRSGSIAITCLSILACLANIVGWSWAWQHHEPRDPEDNLISMTMCMCSTLSAISNVVILFGILTRRSSFLQLPLLFNSLFIVFSLLVGVVTCLFSPYFKPLLRNGVNITLVVFALFAGAAYCLYFLLLVNSVYRKMKDDYGNTALPI